MNIQELKGNWKAGWSLDLHTVSSVPLADGTFDTKRTDVGEMLYKLKYQFDKTQIETIAKKLEQFMKTRLVTPYLSAIIPVLPSDENRPFQPVIELAESLGMKINLPVLADYIIKKKPTEALKSIENPKERQQILSGAFGVRDNSLVGKKVLLFDDLFRSGSTLREITDVLYQQGKVQNVYILTVTRTRSKR